MAQSPTLDSTGPVKLEVKTAGNAIADTFQIISTRIQKSVNRIPQAELVLRDGDIASGSFDASDSDTFKPGTAITIALGYGQTSTTVFSGIIVGQRIQVGRDGIGTLTIECRDKAVAMTVGRKNANYVQKKDSDIASSLIGAYAGLTASTSATDNQWEELVQYYCTDWDFLLARADVNGFVVTVDDGTVSFKAPDTSSAAALAVTYGIDMMEFQANVEVRDQFANVQATAWDMKSQAIVQGTAKPGSLNAQGNLAASELAKVLAVSNFNLQTPTALDAASLKTWAAAQQMKSGLSRVRGTVVFQGSALAKVGGLITLAGVGAHFNGDAYIGGVTHEVQDGNWLTSVGFGLSPVWHAESRDLQVPAASGLTCGIEGLHIGVVKKLAADPNGEFMIQVSIPVLQASTDGVWARLMQFHATSGQGAFFLPEIGDEVVLGYFNNDPSAPVVLGSLYSSKIKPFYTMADDNYKKAITTKTGLSLEYDDEKKVITILTPAKNKIVISDDDKSILLQDQNDNKLKLDTAGISLDSPKDIKLTAQGNISLTATGKVAIKATQDATMDGMNVTHTAQIGFTGKGSATAELSASGQTTVKGAMVMIN